MKCQSMFPRKITKTNNKKKDISKCSLLIFFTQHAKLYIVKKKSTFLALEPSVKFNLNFSESGA